MVKDLLLSLLWCGFDPWPGNLGMLIGTGKKEKKKERKGERERRKEGGRKGKKREREREGGKEGRRVGGKGGNAESQNLFQPHRIRPSLWILAVCLSMSLLGDSDALKFLSSS